MAWRQRLGRSQATVVRDLTRCAFPAAFVMALGCSSNRHCLINAPGWPMKYVTQHTVDELPAVI